MTLHVTNGDSAVLPLRAGGVREEILCWRDVLHEGRVPAGNWEVVRAARARALASLGWTSEAEVLRGFTQRDERLLLAASTGEPVALWFEHDLYDQLQLAQLLAMLAMAGARDVTLVQATDDYLGMMDGAAVKALWGERRLLGEAELAHGAACWRAFTASDPAPLRAFASDDGPLPLLNAAARRLLQEYPAVGSGLARSERQALEVIAQGPRPIAELFRAAHHAMEESTWMGDSSFLAMLARLGTGEHPLVTDDAGVALPTTGPAETFDRLAHITPLGVEVLAGKKDLVTTRGIDRWIGGVHLHGHEVPWRYDPANLSS